MDLRQDLGKPGRVRRLLVLLISDALMLIPPVAVALAAGDRIPGRLLTGALLVAILLTVMCGLIYGLMFAHYWQSPAVQRQATTGTALLGGLGGGYLTLHLISLIDAGEPARVSWFGLSQAPGWLWLASAPVALLAAALAWLVAGATPTPVASDPPPADAVTYRLGPQEKALFTAGMWLTDAALLSLVLLVCGLAMLRPSPLAAVAFLVLALHFGVQAHARLRIDGRGASLVMCGMLRSAIPFEHVRQADALTDSPPAKYFPPFGSAHGFGACTGKGPALGLRLTDGRSFVFSTPEAKTAAGLVNGYLRRERDDADHG